MLIDQPPPPELIAKLVRLLEAMLKPDPQPPTDVTDSPADAMARRMPELSVIEASNLLYATNALGLTDVPHIFGKVSAERTADPSKWITVQGWKAMGMEPPGRGVN